MKASEDEDGKEDNEEEVKSKRVNDKKRNERRD